MAGPPAGAGAAAGAAAAGVRPGAVVRLEGLQQQPDLNGELCKVLRPAAEGRWIVATGRGEKSVKAEHLHSASAQLAVGTRRGLIAGTVATVVLVADLLRSSGQNPVSAALTPVFAVLWLLGTLACCYGLHRPLRDPGVWVPAISEMALAPPARVLYQYGFALVGGLFACTVRLYDVLLASPSRAAAAEGPAPAAAFLDRGAALGYLSAFGVVLQGVVTLEPQLSWRSMVHFGGAILFVLGTMQHASLSNALLAGAAGDAQPAPVRWAQTFRKACSEHGPLMLMLLPLAHQFLQRAPAGQAAGEGGAAAGAAGGAGMQNAMGMAQWALVLNFAAFFCSYACDFWFAAGAHAVP